MAALTADRNVTHFTSRELRQVPMGVDIVYRGGFVGIDPAGYAKAFEVGDKFYGIAYENIDNSAGSAGDKSVRVYTEGDFEHALSAPAAVAIADIGKAVYATDDSTLSMVGHPDAWVGRIMHRDADTTTNAVIRLRTPFDKLTLTDTGSIEHILPINDTYALAGAGSATVVENLGAWQVKSILGLGNVRIAAAAALDPAMKLQFDAVAEIALASIRSTQLYNAAKGITMDVVYHMEDNGDAAAIDTDIGFGTTLTTNSEADIDHADMVDLACFHIDGATANILVQSDDNTTDVAAVDSTVDNVETDAAASFKHHKIIIRPGGAVEFWIAKARILSTTTFAVGAAKMLQAFFNVEKTSDDTTMEANIRYLRVAAASVQDAL